MMTSAKIHVTFVIILIFFERSYVAPQSCKVSLPGLNWFMIYDVRALSASPRGYLMLKKSRLANIVNM